MLNKLSLKCGKSIRRNSEKMHKPNIYSVIYQKHSFDRQEKRKVKENLANQKTEKSKSQKFFFIKKKVSFLSKLEDYENFRMLKSNTAKKNCYRLSKKTS